MTTIRHKHQLLWVDLVMFFLSIVDCMAQIFPHIPLPLLMNTHPVCCSLTRFTALLRAAFRKKIFGGGGGGGEVVKTDPWPKVGGKAMRLKLPSFYKLNRKLKI